MSALPILGQAFSDQAALGRGKPAETEEKGNTSPIRLSAYQGKAALVTLGCAKNQLDSEIMLGVLARNGFELVSDVKEADVAIVNTCGFLQSSIKESIDCVLDIASLKKNGRLRKLIVAGCAVERYKCDTGSNLSEALPEVDAFIALNDLLKVADLAKAKEAQDPLQVLQNAARPYFLYDDSMPRYLSTKPYTAYVKISEGCDRNCAFCIIPKIRGQMRSRQPDSLEREVTQLAQLGVREINLVAQDLTAYGLDLSKTDNSKRRFMLAELLRRIDALKLMRWVRLLYAYPVGISEELLSSMLELGSVCKYLDVPLQHSSEKILKSMSRPVGKYSSRKLIEFIRARAPQIKLRTTFIVGFPGETEEDIRDLENFIAEGHFSSVGVFTYSKEEGTPAASLAAQVPEKLKKERQARLMRAQKSVLKRQLNEYLGEELEVLIEGSHEESDCLLSGRAYFQAPEVDGQVIINNIETDEQAVQPGSFVKARVTEVLGYDLVATAFARC